VWVKGKEMGEGCIKLFKSKPKEKLRPGSQLMSKAMEEARAALGLSVSRAGVGEGR
jgi:hypothetical protein